MCCTFHVPEVRWDLGKIFTYSLKRFSYEGSVWGEKSIQLSTNLWGKMGEKKIEPKTSNCETIGFLLVSPNFHTIVSNTESHRLG